MRSNGRSWTLARTHIKWSRTHTKRNYFQNGGVKWSVKNVQSSKLENNHMHNMIRWQVSLKYGPPSPPPTHTYLLWLIYFCLNTFSSAGSRRRAETDGRKCDWLISPEPHSALTHTHTHTHAGRPTLLPHNGLLRWLVCFAFDVSICAVSLKWRPSALLQH